MQHPSAPITQAAVWAANAECHDALSCTHDSLASHIAKQNCRVFYQELINHILCRFDVKPARVLELGCGTGTYSHLLPGHYTGIDLSEGMIAAARKNCSNGEFTVSSAEEFLRRGNKYDLIFSSSFLHHIFNLDELFALVADSLGSGGAYVGIHEPLRKEFSRDRTPISQVADDVFGVALGWDIEPMPVRKRLRLALRRLTGAISGEPQESNANIDLVDFQLNSRFGPSCVHNAASKAGLKGNILIYSYLRFEAIRVFLGGCRNYFAFLAVKEKE